ncbi:hypothetical protein I3760_02G031600 [Carya illinoinensis]|nr:hypothetical protein I3760_02G031600 [Carya illinoinensis]
MAALRKEALVRRRAEGYMIVAIRRKGRDELQMERDPALTEAEGLKRKGEGSNGQMFELLEFLLSKIAEATQGFNESQKIGQGGYGNIYIGCLHTEVAIKMLHSQGSEGSKEFQMEVGVLGQLRHPNLVKLIGSCPEAFALIYEYLPNGNLEDRLKCKDKKLCSVLVYLHSSTRPHTIVHGDLKPANILLDSNFVCKLSDFGICRGTLPYLDPEFLQSGILTVKSDVYSFGIILLQLLTGKSPPYFIVDEVNSSLLAGNFESLLDPSTGHWPFEVAQSLAVFALMCSDKNRKRRPDLGYKLLNVQ